MEKSVAMRLNSVEFMTEFINRYHSLTCLWNVKSSDYMNKVVKEEAYEDLVQLTRTVYDDADVEFVKSKINVIRGTFRREWNKVQSSIRSGSSTDETYVPKLWYYELMSFLKDQMIPRFTFPSIPEDVIECSPPVEVVYDDDGDEGEWGDHDLNDEHHDDQGNSINTQKQGNSVRRTESNVIPTTAKGVDVVPKAKRKMKQQSQLDQLAKKRRLLHRAENVLMRENQTDEFDAYGVTVAAKLRTMDTEQRLLAELMINKVLYHGFKGRLTESDI